MLSLNYQLKKQLFLFLAIFENCMFARCVFAHLCRSGLRSRRYRKATSALIRARLSANCQGPGLIIFPRVRRLIRLARSDRKYQCFHSDFFRVSQPPPMSPSTAAVTSLCGVNVEPRRRETARNDQCNLSTSRVSRESSVSHVCRVGIQNRLLFVHSESQYTKYNKKRRNARAQNVCDDREIFSAIFH